ncbi:hypothetical protein GCM10028808_48040 [Spirosoma migulaei]
MDSQLVSPVSEFNTVDLRLKGFKVYEIDTAVSPMPVYSRRDFYKICLVTGQNRIHYADRGIEIEGTSLLFANPHIPYSAEALSGQQQGYACLFTEEFLTTHDRSESLQQSPLFKIGGSPVYSLTNEQKDFLTTIFQKMLADQDTDYLFKGELIRDCINLIIHEAIELQPADNFFKPINASSRIASLFLELLERQFPIESPQRPLALRSAQEYADRLSVHVNHLNRSVREVTGKPRLLAKLCHR